MVDSKKCITSQNHAYMYFQCIEQIEPESVIDIGMFLKRTGAVAREAMSREVAPDVQLYGVDYMQKAQVAVYNTIYDEIISPQEFDKLGKKFDMAVLLDSKEIMSEEQLAKVRQWLKTHVKYLLVDGSKADNYNGFATFGTTRELAVEDDKYAIVIFD